MTSMVALLRGINVGKSARIAMADLRRIVESCGCHGVQTYIQSGNVVLSSDDKPDDLANRLAKAIAADTGVSPAVLIRTADEFRQAVARNPFVDRTDDPTKLHVAFAAAPIEPAGILADPERFLPEEFAIDDRHLYLHLPNGMARSLLATELTKQNSGPPSTVRNWRTVLKLDAMLR